MTVLCRASTQSRRKGEKRVVDMSPPPAAPEPGWFRPPPEEWQEDVFTFTPDGADPSEHRVKVRMISQEGTSALVEFAVVHQTRHRGSWCDVVTVDSCHDVDVHLHRYSRRTGTRVGEPETLTPVTRMSDLHRGYEIAYAQVFEGWADNLRRWRDLG